MDDEYVKSQLIGMLAEEHAVPADAVEGEWEQWRSTPESEGALEEASLGDIETARVQFEDHLTRAGLLSEAGYKRMPPGSGKGGRPKRGHVSHLPYPKEHSINAPRRLGGVLGRRGAYMYQASEKVGYEDTDPTAVFGVNPDRRDMAERAFLEKLESGTPEVAFAGADAELSDDYLERLVMEEDPYGEELAEVAGAPFEEELEPIGAHFGRAAFIKMLSALLRRHQMDPQRMERQGNEVGEMVAKAVAAMDRRGRSAERFPEGAEQQRFRRNTVVKLLVRLLDAVGENERPYMQQAAEGLYVYLQGISTAYYGPAEESVEEHLEPIGGDGSFRRLRSGYRRAARFGRGIQKKGRAVWNMRDRAVIANGIVNVVKNMLPPPGSERGPSAKQLNFDHKVSAYVDQLRSTVRVHPGMQQGLVEFVVGAVKRYTIDDAFKYVATTRGAMLGSPESLHIARAAMQELEQFRRPLPATPAQSESRLPISAGAKRMASDLLAHAEAYLDRNPTHVGRASKGVFSLLVPENRKAMGKVSEQLRNGGRVAKDEYLKNALVTHHPNEELTNDHVLALSGMLFHVKEAPGHKVLSQMVRIGDKEQTAHDDVWDAEERNDGGAIMGRSDRHRMLCRVGEPVSLSLERTGQAVSVVPLFYDFPDREARK